MKKIKKLIFYMAFFCAIAVALFSLENTMQLEENNLVIEEIRRPKTRRGNTTETPHPPSIQESSIEENSLHSTEDFIPTHSQEHSKTPLPYIEEKKEDTSTPTSPDIEKPTITEPPKKNTNEKEAKDNEETEFSSIQSGGLTLANGDSWYFEEYDENGNVISTVSYNKKKLISKSQFEYNEEGKKLSATLTEPKKIIKLAFNDKGEEIGRTEYKKRKGQIGDVYSSHQKIYDNEGKLQEETTTENGVIKKKVYTYNGKKVVTETIFENDVKTLFIEYQENIKIVHIFDGEVELSVFEEALE